MAYDDLVAQSFTHTQVPHTGILLVNLGTPEAPTAAAVRRYLAEFLWDPRVVEIPRPLWWLILHLIVLPFRPVLTARKYKTIWTADGSPLLAISQRQTIAIAQRLETLCPGSVKVALGMRYGKPSIPQALRDLRDAGVQRLLLMPLYPQYSAATTATAFDALARELMTWRWLPELRMNRSYHDDPGYINALAESVQEVWGDDQPAERLLFSFHGLPKRNLLAGDPYHCECQKTARLVAEQLGLDEADWDVAFQSRFGRAEWLKPYTSELLKEWAKNGVRSVDVICPGFAADCLETLEEIDVENRHIFMKAGGKNYRYIPALNDSTRHIEALTKRILAQINGWPETLPDYDASAIQQLQYESQKRAIAMGAKQ